MTQEMSEYLNVSAKITSVYAEYNEKLQPLLEAEDALRKERFELVHDLEDLQDKHAKSIEKNGERILRKIDRILSNKYAWGYNVFEHASAFGIEILNDPEESGDQCGMTLRCKLWQIENITDDYVAFKADQNIDGDYSCGVVHIPMEYFATDCLDDDAYLAGIFGELQKLSEIEERKEKELKIKELEQQILKLQGKLEVLREDLKKG